MRRLFKSLTAKSAEKCREERKARREPSERLWYYLPARFRPFSENRSCPRDPTSDYARACCESARCRDTRDRCTALARPECAGFLRRVAFLWAGRPLGAVRRDSRRMKCILENIGIFIAADPAQPVHLKSPANHVGKEGGEFEGANLEHDADRAQLLLHHRDHQARVLIGRGFYGDVKPNSIEQWITGGVEHGVGLRRVVIVGLHIAVVRPALWWKDAACELSLIAPQIFDHRTAVNGIGNRLAHANIFQNGVA